MVDLGRIAQAAFLDPALELLEFEFQTPLLLLPDCTVFLRTAFAPAQRDKFLLSLAGLGRFDKDSDFLLTRIARTRLALYLLPVFLGFELLLIEAPANLLARDQVMVARRANGRQILAVSHATIHHHCRPGNFAGALFERSEHFGHRGAVWSIAGKDFMGFGEAFRIEHQSDHDLLAVRALIARITTHGFGIGQSLPLEISRS